MIFSESGNMQSIPASSVAFETKYAVPAFEPNTAEAAMPEWISETIFGADRSQRTQSFALLDAASIPNLTVSLEVSQAASICLYQGRAREELSEVAPWLVQLDWADNLTRNIFSKSGAPWHLFGYSTLLFFRTSGNMESLRSTLRKLTKIKQADGKSYYLRFWEGLTLFSLLKNDSDGSYCRNFRAGDVVMTPHHVQDHTNFITGLFHADNQ